ARLVRLEDREVRAVTIDDVRAFHASRLAGERIVLIVVGRCEAAAVEKIARKAFDELGATTRSGGGAAGSDGGTGAASMTGTAGSPAATASTNAGRTMAAPETTAATTESPAAASTDAAGSTAAR